MVNIVSNNVMWGMLTIANYKIEWHRWSAKNEKSHMLTPFKTFFAFHAWVDGQRGTKKGKKKIARKRKKNVSAQLQLARVELTKSEQTYFCVTIVFVVATYKYRIPEHSSSQRHVQMFSCYAMINVIIEWS